ncbi:hypothetical protein [Alkaliphilus crotonatoxidans]
MRLILRVEKLLILQQRLRLTDTAMAKKIGISRPQLWRAKQRQPIGEKFIAGFKNAFPEVKLDDFFMIEREKDIKGYNNKED